MRALKLIAPQAKYKIPYKVFKKYIKVQNNTSKCMTKYRLTLTFVSAPKIFHAHDEFVAFWS
jgi:hypothetical protein